MMKTLSGIAVSPGIAIGDAIIKQKKKIKISRKHISPEMSEQEISRFSEAVKAEVAELERFIGQYTKTKEDKELLNAYKAILLDPLLSERIIAMIDKESFSAENALYIFFVEPSNIFGKMTDAYLSERIIDYEDVIFKLINRLTGEKDKLFDADYLTTQNNSQILIMDDISPSDVTKSYHSNVTGIALQKGSKTSHTAIIARALGLPVVVGIQDLLDHSSDKNKVIVDGNKGIVIINPEDKVLREYKTEVSKEQERKRELADIISLPTVSQDGRAVTLMCNIEIEQEIDAVIENNADGVGLFRTEFLYVDRDNLPTEDEQYKLYRSMAEKTGNKQLIIRTFDLGGDKLAKAVQTTRENNPYLGCRGIRLSLRYPEIFKSQVKAILRASHHGNVAIMFPMITSADDMKRALMLVNECKKALDENQIPYDQNMKTGVMIEVPAAVLCAEELARISDFFSIGTNDLVQYTLAADRNSETVEQYYDPYHPALFKLIAMTVNAAHRFEKHISVCGEIASEGEFAILLVSLGVDSLSINPSSYLTVKKQILECDCTETEKLVKQIFRLSSGNEVRELIREYNSKKIRGKYEKDRL